MNTNNIDLLTILNGHTYETFYSDAFGPVRYEGNDGENLEFKIISEDTIIQTDRNGVFTEGGRCCIVPSVVCNDWNVWKQYHCDPVYASYEEYIKNTDSKEVEACENIGRIIKYTYESSDYLKNYIISAIKIYSLIEYCYGGIITKEEWSYPEFTLYTINYDPIKKYLFIKETNHTAKTNHTLLAFRTLHLAQLFWNIINL